MQHKARIRMKDEDQRAEQIERILEVSDSIFKRLLPTVPREILDLDLTTPQMKVVLLLFLNGPTNMSALASELGVSLATTTGVVDRLVERSMLTRDELREDRRVVLCRLSDEGHAVVNRVWTSARGRLRDMLEAVPTSKLALIEEALESLIPTSATELADQ
jgi:DNA-binding MarR family transcriptional regulator